MVSIETGSQSKYVVTDKNKFSASIQKFKQSDLHPILDVHLPTNIV